MIIINFEYHFLLVSNLLKFSLKFQFTSMPNTDKGSNEAECEHHSIVSNSLQLHGL